MPSTSPQGHGTLGWRGCVRAVANKLSPVSAGRRPLSGAQLFEGVRVLGWGWGAVVGSPLEFDPGGQEIMGRFEL